MALLVKNDRKARILIFSFSFIVFVLVTALERVTLNVDLGFNVHVFAAINAIINSIVSLLLIAGLVTARSGRYTSHKYIMLTAIVLSVIFLLTYVTHHLFAGSTYYGDLNKDGMVSMDEKAEAGALRYFYFVLLGSHILLAGISFPLYCLLLTGH